MNITETTSREIYDTIDAVYQIFNSDDIRCWGENSYESERLVEGVLKALGKARAEISYFRATQSWGE